MTSSGGSSPFLESPLVASSKGIASQTGGCKDAERRLISLQYKINTLQNDFEIERLRMQQQNNLIDKKYRDTVDELEKALNDTKYLYETNSKLEKELREMTDKMGTLSSKKNVQIETLSSKLHALEYQSVDSQTALDSKLSKAEKLIDNYKLGLERSKNLLNEYEDKMSRQTNDLRKFQKTIGEKDDEIATLRASRVVMAHHNYSTEELKELTVTNKMLHDQLKYTKELEQKNLQQANELKKLRLNNESQQFWKSENDKLQNKLQQTSVLEKQLEDCQLENLNLKSQIASWEIYSSETDRPEDIIRDWKLAKEEIVVLTDENKMLHLNLSNLKILNDEMALERNQILDLNRSYEASIINLKRLNHEFEQQKQLSFEECKLLRRQLDELSSFNEEAGLQNGEGKELKKYETIVDQYKSHTDDLTEELRKLNEQMQSQEPSLKRKKLSDQTGVNYSQKLNELQLHNVNLLREVQKYQSIEKMLEEKVQKLTEIKEKKIRILQLRDNPLLKDQFIKRKQLQLLKEENNSLLQEIKLGKNSETDYIPLAVYNTLTFESKQREDELFKAGKKLIRLKEIFNKKSLEFIEVVNSLLGFKLEFQQEGKVKIYSCFKPDKYLIANLIDNTFKSNLDSDIDDWDQLLNLWVEERGQIPCFLATITLRLWKSSSSAS